MRFTIISAKHGNPLPQTEYDFSPPGGTIGRGNDNNLVLPDSERAISRLQAIVHVATDGECRLTNRGNVTRVVLNDIVLERGRQVELQDGDILDIGDYRIQVGVPSPAAQENQASRQAPPTAVPSPAAAQPATQALASESGLFDDLLADPRPVAADATPAPDANVASADVSDEIWNDLLEEFTAPPAQTAPVARAPEPDINPFEAPGAPDRNPENPLAHLAPVEDILTPGNIATDALFNEESLFQKETIFSDTTPTALTATPGHSDPVRQLASEPQDALDPLALFAQDGESTHGDDPLALITGQAAPLATAGMPETVVTQVPAPPDLPEPPPQYAPVTLPPGLQASAGYSEITLPTPQAVTPAAQPASKGRLRIDPVQSTGGLSLHEATGGEGALSGDMLDALLEGMGLSDVRPQPQFDRENLHQIGQLLSLFSQGTVALLSSRSILKRGVKADMTMVLEDANNPFKLLPSGKTVLMQMFGTRMPGFMSPTKSVRDALIDLQAHQLGMIAGIRAIIAAMLQSFNPEQLEAQAKAHGALSRLSLLSNRKAALWDYFTRHYAQTAGEIEDDFHTLFGEAFLHAYDMEVNQYKDSQSGAEKP